MKKFKFIDLFSGLGGFRIAMESVGGKCVFSSDIDQFVQKVYEENFGDLPFGDITKIDEKEIPDHDILCAGFPCQPFSIGGLRKGFTDTRGTLFFHIERILREKKPKVFFLENVRGLENHDKGRTLQVMLDILADVVNDQPRLIEEKRNLGYKVYYKILNSKNFNVPQNRERIYIVGFRNHNINFSFPKEQKSRLKVEDLLDTTVNIENYRVSNIVKGHLDRHLKKKHIDLDKSDLLIANEIRPSRCSFRDDGISPCLTAKMGTGGNNVPILVKYLRKLTVTECLRIQGFPNWYKIKENNMQSYKAIGNSVSVPVLKAISRNIVKEMNL